MLIIKKLFFCWGQKKPPPEDYSPVFNFKGCQNKREGLQNYDTLVYGRECQKIEGWGSMEIVRKVGGNSLISQVHQFNALFM